MSIPCTPQHYPWQEKQWRRLLDQYQGQRLPHALLLAGANGLGKYAFAQAFAAHILCENPGESICGNCQSCAWFAAGTHPDLFYVRPEEDSKTHVIKIEAIRELVDALTQTAQQGKSAYQVVILEPAESMNKAAANALLKTLEEPSGRVIFLLVTHQPAALLPTIRSRCQQVIFPIPTQESSLTWLKTQVSDEKNPQLLLQLADYLPLRALTLEEKARHTISENFLGFLENTENALSCAAAYQEYTFEEVFGTLWSITMDLVRLKLQGDAILNSHQHDRLLAISNHCSLPQLYQFLENMLESKRQIEAKINLSKQLMYEAWFLAFKRNPK